MVRTSVRTTSFTSRPKTTRNRQLINKAAGLLRARMAGPTRAPLATRGWYGSYNRRGRAELKLKDTTALNVPLADTWDRILINGVAQGSDFTDRIGRKVTMKSIVFNGNLFPGSTTGADASKGCYGRFVIVYDTQPNSGSLPAGTDVFATNDPNSPMNLNNRDRFQVILDVRKQLASYTFTAATTKLATGSPANAFWKKYKKMNKEVIFSGTGNVIGNISTGALYLFYIGDFPGVAMIDHYCRVRYTDE